MGSILRAYKYKKIINQVKFYILDLPMLHYLEVLVVDIRRNQKKDDAAFWVHAEPCML